MGELGDEIIGRELKGKSEREKLMKGKLGWVNYGGKIGERLVKEKRRYTYSCGYVICLYL